MKASLSRVLVVGIAVMFLGACGSALFKGNMLAYATGTIYIRADGSVEGTTLIQSSDNITYVFTADVNDSIVVERNNIIIDGDGYNLTGPYTDAGFTLIDLNRVTIRNVNIVGFGFATWLEGCSQCIIANNTATNNEGGIWLISSMETMVSGNNVTRSVEGVALASSNDNTVTGNNITSSLHYGVYLFNSSAGNTVSGNNIIGMGAHANVDGVYLESSSGNSVSGNAIANNSRYGIRLTSSSNNNTLSGNNITANSDVGIYLDASSNNAISGNNVGNSPNEHIGLLNSANNNIISGNNLTNSTADVGVYVYACSRNSFWGNNITLNADSGIRIDSSSDTTIYENNLSQNPTGVYLWYCSNITVYGNNITRNSQYGIYLYYSNENAILSNDLYANPGAGIYIYASSNNTVQKNTNSSGYGSQYGIVLWNYSHYNIVSENVLSPYYRGITMGYSDDNRILNNTVSNTEIAGIEVQQICNNSIIANNVVSNNNLYGISIWPSDEATRYNVIRDNNITHNLVGIHILRLSGNIIYHNNFIDNTNQTSVFNSASIWDDGYPSGGNYWSNYNGTDEYKGPDQDILGSDLIGDDPYDISENNTDHYPLMTPYETTPPTIAVLSPENKTYAVNASIPLTFTVDELAAWMGYSLNGQANVTITENTTLPLLPDGHHYVTVYANDTFGTMGSATVHFTVDTTTPDITNVVQDPLTEILPDTEVKVNATVTDATSGVKQVQLNCTFTNGTGTWHTAFSMTPLAGDVWNATIPPNPYGTNVTYVIIAEDNAGNTITSEQAYGYKYEYQVIPEFSLPTILLAFMTATLVTAIISKKKRKLPA